MLIAADIGNTNITLGAYSGDELVFTVRLATDPHRTADQYAVEIRDMLDINGCAVSDIDDSVICSVVPAVSKAVAKAFIKLCGHAPLVLGPGVKTGLNIKIDTPSQTGADLVAGAVGALAKYPMPCAVVDMGTATTISVLNQKGEMIGGVIAAGIGITLQALCGRTAQLPAVDMEAPAKVIGTNTVDCMKSGLIVGAAAMLDGMIDRIEEELGQAVNVVATGGLAGEVISCCRRKVTLDDTLLLDGLKLIWQKNCKK